MIQERQSRMTTGELLQIACTRSAAYLADLDDRDVMPTSTALAKLGSFDESFPSASSRPEDVLEILDSNGSPNTVATTGGRFFGFVVGGALPVAVAASWLATAWDQNAGTWLLSPVAGKLEEVVSGWLLDIFDLPRDCAVGFVTGSTMGAFSSIAAARSALFSRLGHDFRRNGFRGAPRLRIVASPELHPTNIAALGYAGFGRDNIELCRVDSNGRIDPAGLPVLDANTIVLLQAGNINGGGCDPFPEICKHARAAGAWVHIDGAFGLWARASTAKQYLVAGMEEADSWSVDGHKWLNLPQDTAVYICRDQKAVQEVFAVEATYLVRDANRQPNNFTPELSRRARGVEFWAALKTLGRSGLEALIDDSCRHALYFSQELAKAGYQVLNEVSLNQVVFAGDSEAVTRRAMQIIQESGVCWLGPTRWKDMIAMRISVCSWATGSEDVERSLEVMRTALVQAVTASELQDD